MKQDAVKNTILKTIKDMQRKGFIKKVSYSQPVTTKTKTYPANNSCCIYLATTIFEITFDIKGYTRLCALTFTKEYNN